MPVTENGHKYLAVFMEYCTRYPEVFPIRDITAQTMADLFIRKIVCRYGVPLELLTDQGTQLTSEMMKYICAKLGTVKIQTSPYHAMSDGLVERFMDTLVKMLAQYVSTTQKDWSNVLDYVLFAYRTSVQSSLKETAHFLMFGTDAQLPLDSALGLPNPSYVDQPEPKIDFVQCMNQAWELAAQNLEKAQNKQKQNYKQKLHLPQYQCQDLVWVYTPSVKKGRSPKLAHLWHGPFHILKISGPIAQVRPVNNPKGLTKWVHFNRIKPCRSACLVPLVQEVLAESSSSSAPLPAPIDETLPSEVTLPLPNPSSNKKATTKKESPPAENPHPPQPAVAHRRKKTKRSVESRSPSSSTTSGTDPPPAESPHQEKTTVAHQEKSKVASIPADSPSTPVASPDVSNASPETPQTPTASPRERLPLTYNLEEESEEPPAVDPSSKPVATTPPETLQDTADHHKKQQKEEQNAHRMSTSASMPSGSRLLRDRSHLCSPHRLSL